MNKIKLYKNINNIFGDKNNAIGFRECFDTRKAYIKKQKIYDRYYYEVEDVYQQLLKKLANIIKEIRPNLTLKEIFFIYVYILRSGYLSLDKQLSFMYPDREIPIRQGISVVTGKSVCRNFATMLEDLLLHFNINSIAIMTDRYTISTEKIHIYKGFFELKKENDTQTDEFENQFESFINNDNKIAHYGNHIEVLTINQKMELLDPTAICMSTITNKKRTYQALDYIKLWHPYATNVTNLKSSCYLYELLKDKSLTVIRDNNIIKIEEKCFNLCEQNKQKILSFHNSIQYHISYLNTILNN